MFPPRCTYLPLRPDFTPFTPEDLAVTKTQSSFYDEDCKESAGTKYMQPYSDRSAFETYSGAWGSRSAWFNNVGSKLDCE